MTVAASATATTAAARLAYLGPEGTFTHAAALALGEHGTPVPLATVTDVYDAVASGAVSTGVVAIESSVEGYVVPSLDERIWMPPSATLALPVEYTYCVSPDTA